MSDKYETVWRAIQATLDDTGHGTSTRADLALSSGVSEPTVYRAIQAFIAAGRIECERKRGKKGGLLFGPVNRSNRSAKTDQTDQTDQVTQCLSQTDQGRSSPDLIGLGTTKTDQTDQAPEKAQWFICCIWNDENGAMWCHGDDGYLPYIPCESKEAAHELAEEHHRTPHRGLPSHRASFPNVDVCRELFNGKQLDYRYVATAPGLVVP